MSLLRPGLHLVRRDDRHLQVGVDPPWRLVVPDEPEVRRLVADLRAGRSPTPDSPAAHRVLRRLVEADMVLEVEAVAATARSRAAALVSVEPVGRTGTDATRLLQEAGCRVGGLEAATVALILCAGELPRSVPDAHLRAGRPHLPVTATAGGYRLGPFAVPGVTACTRCLDAHLAERDPRRAVVVEQLVGLDAGPADPTLESIATAWAVRDVVTFVEGGLPSTWSATVDIGPGLPPRRREWGRHPHCGCAWSEGLLAGAAG